MILLERCPKCHGNLFQERYTKKGVYFCINCGMRGTLEEMKKKLPLINSIVEDTVAGHNRKYASK